MLPSDDSFAAQLRGSAALRGFGPVGILAFFAILSGNLLFAPLSALLVLIWARESRTPWRELGFALPESWPRTVVAGVVMGVTLKLVMKALVMPLLGAAPRNAAYQFLVGNEASLLYMIYASIVVAGVGEEVLSRGFLFERGRRLIGNSAAAKIAVVAVSSVWFGLGHYPEQGWPGVQQALVVGLLYGTIFAVSGRLWMLMISHAVFDLTAVAIIYLDLEEEVAGFFFG